jgi:hypothetical protein
VEQTSTLAHVGLLLLFDATGNAVMWGALLLAVALTVWEVRQNKFTLKGQMWWILLVLLIHVPGYLLLRVVTAFRQWKVGQGKVDQRNVG